MKGKLKQCYKTVLLNHFGVMVTETFDFMIEDAFGRILSDSVNYSRNTHCIYCR